MDTIWIIVIAGAGTVALLIYGLSSMFGRNRAILAERLETYAGIEAEAALATDVEMQPVGGLQGAVNTVMGRGYLKKIEDGLVQADVPMKAFEYVLARLVLGGLGVIVSLFLLPDPHNPTIQLLRTVAIGSLGFFTPAIWVKFHKRRRRNKFVSQLADALMLLTNSLRSGYGFLKGLELVAKEMSDPISKELNRMLREINLGATVEQALLNLGRRVNSQDLDIVISAYLIQKDVGGNLTEIMEKVAETIRERIKIHGDIRVLTAQGRLSGLIVGLLPVALFIFFLFNTPDYFAPMFLPPNFEILPHIELPVGVLWLLGAAIWQMIGGYVIYRVIDIKV
ncbi:MAG: type II secretion system F family protein [Verrucomicrobiota bacterium]